MHAPSAPAALAARLQGLGPRQAASHCCALRSACAPVEASRPRRADGRRTDGRNDDAFLGAAVGRGLGQDAERGGTQIVEALPGDGSRGGAWQWDAGSDLPSTSGHWVSGAIDRQGGRSPRVARRDLESGVVAKAASGGNGAGTGASGVVTTGIVEVRPETVKSDGPGPGLQFGVSAAQGPRATMEDEAIVFPDGKCGFMMAMVLDGHDGLPAVQWLADHMFDIFSDVIDDEMFSGTCSLDLVDGKTGLCCPVNITPVLMKSFESADKELLEHLKEKSGVRAAKSGSTATIALVKRDRIIVANVGDSRAVLCRNGAAFDLTTEHRVCGNGTAVQPEIERVKSVGGWVSDGRVCDVLAVSRAFGDWEFKGEGRQHGLAESVEEGFISREFAAKVHFTGDPIVATPDVTELALGETDEFVIIATDGLWDAMPSADAVRYASREIEKGKSSQQVADGLVDLALKRYTSDNVAAVVIDLVGAAARRKRRATGQAAKKKAGVWGF